MDWAIFLGVTLVAAVVTGLVALGLARMMGRSEGEIGFTPILLAIVLSLVVLLGAAKLAVAVDWLYARAGVATDTALGGQFFIIAFAASFVPIASYVVTFLLTFRKVRGA